VNGTEVNPEIVDDDDNNDGGGKEGIGGEGGVEGIVGFDSSSVDELIDDGEGVEGGSTDGGGDTNNNQDSTTEEKAPWTDTTTTNPGGDTNIILINNIPYSTYYSCTATEDELVSNTSNNNNGVEELPIAFSYEIYTPTTKSVDEQRNVLDNFERQLAKGVAESLGLVDCNDNTAGSVNGGGSDDNGVAVEIALRSSEGGGGRQLSNTVLGSGGLRRSLLIDGVELEKQQIRLLDNGGSSTSSVVGISMNPIDMVDTEIGKCRG